MLYVLNIRTAASAGACSFLCLHRILASCTAVFPRFPRTEIVRTVLRTYVGFFQFVFGGFIAENGLSVTPTALIYEYI